MRAVLDTNLSISYLLAPTATSPPVAVVEAAFTGAYMLLLSDGVVAELTSKSATKPYLAAHISRNQTERLVRILETVAETVDELDEPFPAVGRDRKDDYLFAHAVMGRADYLVSGDKGVQAVRRIGSVHVVSPTEFLQVLRRENLVVE